MGCCCFNSEIEEVQQKENNRLPLTYDSNPSYISPKNMNRQQTGESLKLQGNQHFKQKEFEKAIQAYNKAITLPNPNVSYYSNLALAYKANGQYTESIQIVDEMIRKSTFHSYQNAQFFRKAQIIKSRCIIIQVKDYCLSGNYTEKNSRSNLALITNAVSLLEEIISVPNTNQEIQSYLESGVKIRRFLEKQVVPASKKHSIINYLQSRLAEVQFDGTIRLFYESEKEILSQISLLVKLQMKAALQQPDQCILDPITYDIFENPVIVPSGQSYDEPILLEHFKNNGYNDPITHEIYKLGQKTIIRNISLKNYITQTRKIVHRNDLDYLKY